MPTGSDYVTKDLHMDGIFYGVTIGAFPVGRMCLLMLMGYWSDKRGFRGPFRTTFLLGMIGGLVYGLASGLQFPYFAVLGRFFGGLGATGPYSAWAARTYPPEKRVRIESIQKTAQLAGVVIGPAFNVLFVGMNVDMGWLKLNPNTMAGYFPAMLNAVLFVGFFFGVDEPPRSVRVDTPSQPTKLLFRTGSWVCLVSAFATNLQVTAVDVIFAPLAKQHLGFGDLAVSGCFAALAVISAAGSIIGIVADKKGATALQIMLGGCLLNIATTSGIALSLKQAPDVVLMIPLCVVGSLGVASIFIYTGACGGLYQQCSAEAQGLLGGIYLMFFAGGRPVGAILAGALLAGNPAPLCWSITLMTVISTVLLLLFWKRLSKADRAARANKSSLLSGASDANRQQQDNGLADG